MDAIRQMNALIRLQKTPKAFYKYEKLPEFQRIKHIGYYCGTDWGSKAFYHYQGFTSRFGHSRVGGNQVNHLKGGDFTAFMAYETHDIGSPCFSHTIDYMNKDYITQESTEEKNREIIMGNPKMLEYFKEDGVDLDRLFELQKGNSIVNNNRPKLCMDRVDGIIIPALTWLQVIDLKEAKQLYNDLILYTNEDGEDELSFKHESSIKRIIELNQMINNEIRADYDFYFMDTLANIVRIIIDKGVIQYNDLYTLTEPELVRIINLYCRKNPDVNELWYNFQHATTVPNRNTEIKDRIINPILRLDSGQVIRYNNSGDKNWKIY